MIADSDIFEVHPSPQKIGPVHLQRLAVVYVRQSTAQQVLQHQESTRLQYGLTVPGSWAGPRRGFWSSMMIWDTPPPKVGRGLGFSVWSPR